MANLKKGLRIETDREFHVSRACRDLCHFDKRMFGLRGNVILADFHSVREFAHCLRSHPESAKIPEANLSAGQVNAMGLIDEILHFVVALYQQQKKPQAMPDAMEHLDRVFSKKAMNACLLKFSAEFPPSEVYRSPKAEAAYRVRLRRDLNLRSTALEEMLLLRLANENPAFAPYALMFSDAGLRQKTRYAEVMTELSRFFDRQPFFGPDEQNLIRMLRSPAEASPDSLDGQIEFIRSRWGFLLHPFFDRLLISLDLIREERKTAPPGPGPQEVPDFSGHAMEEERFSPDADWMPRLVLMAKSVYVWLDQLSQKHGRRIATLDGIPDEELEQLARWGFSGLWLIGVWERSRASETIKRLCGNPEAAASAYALHDYRIAEDLGGERAFLDLKARAFRLGIRLAADMVPNHMGIDSSWVIEHPQWFVQMDHSPFPAYRFSGPDLSSDDRVALMLEDRYYTRQDAAVVFKRADRRTGDVRYIYHGNDGTRMPWNDTAQLNFLLPEVREAVMQAILRVASWFPIVRFDAAMTLTKKHYQRLWFPLPSTGGDIPSRSGQGMEKAAFDRCMPAEFWREVVDRISGEAPDTLLLAEAFWLLEGYFVRTLGMHRVYNSAFMNFLKNEETDRFRGMLKEILLFQPEILARFVNFLNNPDEETAVTQFGKGDKYFGVCTLMVTLPGLPMFGHGQVEGFGEKYGMEYRRAYWSERVDADFVRRHEREIFPLVHRRRLFAGVSRFHLFDFVRESGEVDENVVAFSNQTEAGRALILFNNTIERTAGRIHRASPRQGRNADLLDALSLERGANRFVAMREMRSGLEYLVSAGKAESQGMRFELEGYQTLVFIDIWELVDDERRYYRALASRLNGRGVGSLGDELRRMSGDSFTEAFKEIFCDDFFLGIARIMELRSLVEKKRAAGAWKGSFTSFFRVAAEWVQHGGDPEMAAAKVVERLLSFSLARAKCRKHKDQPQRKHSRKAVRFLRPDADELQDAIAGIVCDGLASVVGERFFARDVDMLQRLARFFGEKGAADGSPFKATEELLQVMKSREEFFAVIDGRQSTGEFFRAWLAGYASTIGELPFNDYLARMLGRFIAMALAERGLRVWRWFVRWLDSISLALENARGNQERFLRACDKFKT